MYQTNIRRRLSSFQISNQLCTVHSINSTYTRRVYINTKCHFAMAHSGVAKEILTSWVGISCMFVTKLTYLPSSTLLLHVAAHYRSAFSTNFSTFVCRGTTQEHKRALCIYPYMGAFDVSLRSDRVCATRNRVQTRDSTHRTITKASSRNAACQRFDVVIATNMQLIVSTEPPAKRRTFSIVVVVDVVVAAASFAPVIVTASSSRRPRCCRTRIRSGSPAFVHERAVDRVQVPSVRHKDANVPRNTAPPHSHFNNEQRSRALIACRPFEAPLRRWQPPVRNLKWKCCGKRT